MADVVTFDPVNLRIIEISTGGDNELDWLEIYSEWKDWLLADASRMGLPQAFRVVGGDPISGTANLGSTFFMLSPWKFRPAEHDHRLTLTGNMFSDPAGESVVVPTVGTFTVLVEQSVSNLVDSVLVNSPDIQFSSFDSGRGVGVLVDMNNSTGLAVSSTEFPTGTPRQPVDNFTDALAIANDRGFNTIYVIGQNITLGSGLNYQGFRFFGQSPALTSLTVDPSAQVTGAEFYDMTLNGEFDGSVRVLGCLISDMSMVEGDFLHCGVSGTITLNGGGVFSMVSCWDAIAGIGVPALDYNGGSQPVILRYYQGALTLRNKVGNDEASIDITPGRIILESTITGGDFIIKGIGQPVDNQSTGTTSLDDSGLISLESIDDTLVASHGAGSWESASGLTVADIADAVWDEAAADHVTPGTTGAQLADIETDADAARVAAQSADSTITTVDGKLNTVDSNVDQLLTDVAAGAFAAGDRQVLEDILKHLSNRLDIDFTAQQLVLYDDDGSTVLQRWDISTDGGEPVVTNTGVQSKRGVPLL